MKIYRERIDFKQIEMDRVLTSLFARIHHKGEDSRLYKKDTTIETFERHFLENPERFRGDPQAIRQRFTPDSIAAEYESMFETLWQQKKA